MILSNFSYLVRTVNPLLSFRTRRVRNLGRSRTIIQISPFGRNDKWGGRNDKWGGRNDNAGGRNDNVESLLLAHNSTVIRQPMRLLIRTNTNAHQMAGVCFSEVPVRQMAKNPVLKA